MRRASRSPTPRWLPLTSNPLTSTATGTTLSLRGAQTGDAVTQAQALSGLSKTASEASNWGGAVGAESGDYGRKREGPIQPCPGRNAGACGVDPLLHLSGLVASQPAS